MAGQPSDTFNVFNLRVVEISPGEPPSNIINQGQTVRASVDFRFFGFWANWLVSQNLTYVVRLSLESIGSGPEFTFVSDTGTTSAGQLNYTESIQGQVNLPPGVYKTVATVTFPGSPPAPIAGYDEGPILQVV